MTEYWDLYDKDRNKINKVVKRGEYLSDDEYHIVVNVWIRNSNNEFLITQRSENKSHPLMWECTGGSALSGETSLEAAIREVKEELGIDISKCKNKLIGSKNRYYEGCPDILDVWLFECNVDIKNVVIQKEEVNDAMWCSKDEIIKLYNDGKFEANAYFNEVLDITSTDVYYIGFNANNAICNDGFFAGSITLYPTLEKGNIFYSDKLISDTSSPKFLEKYHDFVYKTALKLQSANKNSYFICFNEKIRKLCSDMLDINIVRSNNPKILNLLNNKFKTRAIAKKYMPILKYKNLISTNLEYENIKELINSDKFVIQAETGSGGDNTFLVTCKEDMPILNKDSKYCVSEYVNNTPLNISLIIYDDGIQFLPISAQLILLSDYKFKYVGGDFVFAQNLSNNVIDQIKEGSLKISNHIKDLGYRGILGIDFILKDGIVYFMEINPRFQASTFLISKVLRSNYNTDVAELHYNALIGNKKTEIVMETIDYSFLNCNNNEKFDKIKNYIELKNGYFKDNKSSNYRKLFKRSIINEDLFEKEK